MRYKERYAIDFLSTDGQPRTITQKRMTYRARAKAQETIAFLQRCGQQDIKLRLLERGGEIDLGKEYAE